MAQIAVAEPLALPGETVLSPEAWVYVQKVATGTPMALLDHTCDSPATCGIPHRHNVWGGSFSYQVMHAYSCVAAAET